MPRPRSLDAGAKTYYRPIEAAIRWCGLIRFEARILAALGDNQIPEPRQFPRWPRLRLCTERIVDAVVHGELRQEALDPSSSDCASPSECSRPAIRHVELKKWMSRYYPGERPPFLFDEIERALHPAVTLQAVNVLLAERQATNVQLSELERVHQTLRLQYEELKSTVEGNVAASAMEQEPGPRAETTYLNIIGALLFLLLGKTPSGAPYSSFRTQEAVISALLAHHPSTTGIAQRTLQAKFALARRSLGQDLPELK